MWRHTLDSVNDEQTPEPLTDAELDELDAAMTDRARLLDDLQQEQMADMRRYRAEVDRRNPPGTVHEFRPRPGWSDGCSL
jgi:hypothetical protein